MGVRWNGGSTACIFAFPVNICDDDDDDDDESDLTEAGALPQSHSSPCSTIPLPQSAVSSKMV